MRHRARISGLHLRVQFAAEPQRAIRCTPGDPVRSWCRGLLRALCSDVQCVHRAQLQGISTRQRLAGGSATTLQTSKASGLVAPRTVLNGPKHSMLSLYRRCQVLQSV